MLKEQIKEYLVDFYMLENGKERELIDAFAKEILNLFKAEVDKLAVIYGDPCDGCKYNLGGDMCKTAGCDEKNDWYDHSEQLQHTKKQLLDLMEE